MKTRLRLSLGSAAALAASALVVLPALGQPAPGERPRGGLTAEQEAELSHTHDGFLGALAP